MTELKPMILCADDFAQDQATSDAVLRLVELRRLSAVSCFTDGPLWQEAGAELTASAGTVLLGLHFNLSYPFGFDEKPLPFWVAHSLLGRVDRATVRSALRRQVENFVTVVGRPPDYIDGHQHVHAFPVIRDVVLAAAGELCGGIPVRLRDLSRPIGRTDAPLKRAVIHFMAGARSRSFGALALNSAFGGDYSLSTKANYGELFTGWLRSSPPQGLIMCHPRRSAGGARETAGDHEYEFLASARFEATLARAACRLVKRATELTPSALGP